jgi:hypothetical protein
MKGVVSLGASSAVLFAREDGVDDHGRGGVAAASGAGEAASLAESA